MHHDDAYTSEPAIWLANLDSFPVVTFEHDGGSKSGRILVEIDCERGTLVYDERTRIAYRLSRGQYSIDGNRDDEGNRVS